MTINFSAALTLSPSFLCIFFVLFIFLFVLIAGLALLENKRQKQHAPNVFTHDLGKAQPGLAHTHPHMPKNRTHSHTHKQGHCALGKSAPLSH